MSTPSALALALALPDRSCRPRIMTNLSPTQPMHRDHTVEPYDVAVDSTRPAFLEPLIFGSAHDVHPGHPTHDHWGRHAWVVLGTETIFLWHMVMGWMQGHNYEVVLEVDLPDPVREAILQDRKNNGHSHIIGNRGDTLPLTRGACPPGHSLPQIKSGEVRSFIADAWNYIPTKPASMSWPYSESSEFIKGFNVQVKRVVHYRHVDMNISGQRFENYVLFGKGAEAHVCHTVVDQPDYDHAATLRRPPDWLDHGKLEAGVFVSVPALPWYHDRTRCVNPLPDGEPQRVLYHGIERYRPWPPPCGEPPGENVPVPCLKIEVDRTWWFSTRVVNHFLEQPCGGLGDIPEPKLNPLEQTDECRPAGRGHHHE